MNRPDPKSFFLQTLKSDAFHADELINIYILRPIAAGIVWLLYPTPVTPNQVTIAAVLIGLCSAWAYAAGTPAAIAVGGVLILLKDITDDADGQLARAKEMYSRRGRFLDSIGDFVVDAAVFSAITAVAYRRHPSGLTVILGIVSLFGITLRVSYHVYYQVSFLHRQQRYQLNRIRESVTEEDRAGDPVALALQRIFNVIYGWQDALMRNIDTWCKGVPFDEQHAEVWYADRAGLRLSGLLGFGTELTLLAVFSWCNAIYEYLFFNAIVMNAVLLTSIAYRRLVLARNIPQKNREG